MKRSEQNAAIARALANAEKYNVPLPIWVDWHPLQFDANADGLRTQKLGWKVIDFGWDDFAHCGLVVLAVCSSIVDQFGQPVTKLQTVGGYDYPVTCFSRKFLFVQAGQTEPHHFHRQKTRKEVTVLGGAPVHFQLSWAESDTALSATKPVDVQVDGIWHQLEAEGTIVIKPGQTITLPGDLSHIISVPEGGPDTIMLETSTANNDRSDNIFPYKAPVNKPIVEDEKVRYQHLDEHSPVVGRN